MVSLRVAQEIALTEAEGPGRRYAIWTQGCRLRCPGCCNPELFDAGGGRSESVATLATRVSSAASEHKLEGLTLLGGEPLDQLEATAQLCAHIAAAGLGVIIFTGYTLTQARNMPHFSSLWENVDTLVDGPFNHHERTTSPIRWLGSNNQRARHRTARYANATDWRGPNHAEIQVRPDGSVTVHGFPSEVQHVMGWLHPSR